MGKLSASQRKAIPQSQFGLPSKASSPAGKAKAGSYPMPDVSHAKFAKAMAAKHASPAQRAQIDAKANRIIRASGGKPGKGK